MRETLSQEAATADTCSQFTFHAIIVSVLKEDQLFCQWYKYIDLLILLFKFFKFVIPTNNIFKSDIDLDDLQGFAEGQ